MEELKIMLILDVMGWLMISILLVVVPAMLGLWVLAVLTAPAMIMVLILTIAERIDDYEKELE